MFKAIFTLFTVLMMFQPVMAMTEAQTNQSTAVFYVAWYDDGKAALDGKQGIKKVKKGFQGSREINTVTFDKSVISIKEMEKILKDIGTYRGTEK